jgi:flavodoxin
MIKFFSPSYKRAGKIDIAKWLPNVVLCVHEFEEKEYRRHHKNELLILPDSLRGNMAKVRNYILENSVCDVCVMMDDDVQFVGYYENGVQVKMAPGRLIEKITEWYHQAAALNTVLFGVNLQTDYKFYKELSPLTFKNPILGTFSCVIKKGNNIRYDERLSLNEDYDYFLQVMRIYHKVLRWNKYHYQAGHLKEPGGCGAYRTLKREKEQAEIMIKKWGKSVVRYDFNRSTNPIVNVPIKGI